MSERRLHRLTFLQAPATLAPNAAALLREMEEAYATRRLGALRHRETSVHRDLNILHDFVAYSGKPPWDWTESDFDHWCQHIGLERKLKIASQRVYQTAIRCFLQYLVENIKFRNEVWRLFGKELRQICHRGNCIPHVQERELSSERRELNHEEVSRFFSGIDDAIEESAKFASKGLRPLQRDKALFYTAYVFGLRPAELLGINLSSFRPNPAIPEFGRYGFVSVVGKGGKPRLVPVTHKALPPLLAWYEEAVRPHFLLNGDANEQAFFLSERCKRLHKSTLDVRFHLALERAGIPPEGLVPHSFRHSSVTHESMRGLSTEAVRRKHGHVFASTTQGYFHVSDEFVQDEISKVIGAQIDEVLGDENE